MLIILYYNRLYLLFVALNSCLIKEPFAINRSTEVLTSNT